MSKGVATKQRTVSKSTFTSEQLTAKPEPVYDWRAWGQGLAALAVLLGCLVWLGAGGQYAYGAGLAAGLGVGQAIEGRRREVRAERAARAHTAIMHSLAFPIACGVEWGGHGVGAPLKLVIDYPPYERGERIEAAIAQAVNSAWAPQCFIATKRSKTRSWVVGVVPSAVHAAMAWCGRVVSSFKADPVNRVVLWSYDPEAPDAEPEQTPLEVLEGRILDVSEQVFGDGSKVVDITSEGDQVLDFVVEHKYGPRLVDERVQILLSTAVSQMIHGQWGATFDLENDKAMFHWRRPLPRNVPRPVNPDLPSDTMIALAVNEDGEYAVWDFDGLFAHLLIAGRTRTGKTVLLRGVLMMCCLLGHRVFVIDPKRIEFVALRDWPNVELVASKVEDQLALLIYLRELMMERYRLIEEEGYSETDFERIVVVIDEYKQFVANVASWWRQNKGTGMPAQCPVLDYVGDLLRLAAAARIHIVEGTQRPDADTLGGENRDNFSARCSTGSLSPDGAKMMYDNERLGVAVPKIQGRGYFAGTDDRPQQVQFFWTPNPRTATSAEDIALVEALRPKTTRWPRKAWHYLDEVEVRAWQKQQAELGHEVKGSMPWLQILTASLESLTPGEDEDVEILVDEDRGDGYGPEETICPSDLVTNDLILLDQDGQEGMWVTVTEVRIEGPDSVWIGWLSDDDDGLMSTNDEVPVTVRHLLPFDDDQAA